MTVEGRLGIAGGCTLAGILLAWAVYHPPQRALSSSQLVSSAPIETASGTGAPLLWVVAIGVSDYRREELSLQFAGADAHAVAAALERQGGGPLYKAVNTLVLTNEEVTRESILDSLTRFLGQASRDDVAVIFLAGHGVQDRASGSYYFLPFPAAADNVLTAGLRMSDFDDLLRMVRRTVRATVVMLDTCHAGALRLGAPDLLAADEPAARLSVGEGSFLLAASRPGEQSQETAELAHGAFTYALLGALQGGADGDHDGWITVSELFGYVAREVPRVTGGLQHPYHKMEGTDIVIAAAKLGDEPLTPPPTWQVAQAVPRPVATRVLNTIGVMPFNNLRADPQHDWIGTALRVAFNTELSKVRALHVYAPELIDRTAKASGLDELATAQELGIDRLIAGSFSVVGDSMRIDARIVDADSGLQEGSDSIQGNLSEFFDLQKKLVLSMLRRLRVKLSAEEGNSIRTETNTDVDAYRLLLETEEMVEGTPAAPPTPATPRSEGRGPRSDLGMPPLAALLWSRADAQEFEATPEAAVRRLLDEYRRALEARNLDRLAELYVAFSDNRREALRAYFDNAADLEVELADITVTPNGDEMAVSYTRRDRFIDKASGKPVRLEVRLTRIVVQEGGQWKIAGRP
jgi:TolB-like protein/ketosteroid isomerase-like protein